MNARIRDGHARLAAAGMLAMVLTAPVAAQATSRVSLAPGGVQGTLGSYSPAISGDGRYVTFYGVASNLVLGDTNGAVDIFVRDRVTGTTERVSVDSSGVQGNAHSWRTSISADGRYVAFTSSASNLVAGDTNGDIDVFIRDRQNATTELVSVSSAGVQGNAESLPPTLSADGRYVAFASFADNLVGGDTNGWVDVFLRDRQNGTTDRVSLGPGGAQANEGCAPGSISADGRFVAYSSAATNLVAGDTNATDDAFVYDRIAGTTERVSLTTTGGQGDDGSIYPVISGDGRYVAYFSMATNLVPGDMNGIEDVYVRDRQTGTTLRASVSHDGTQVNNRCHYPSISEDGRYVAFHSAASNLDLGNTGGWIDVFVRDLQAGTTERVSRHSSGQPGNGDSEWCSISSDGRFVTYSSYASNLVPGDTNGFADVFVRDRAADSMTSVCDPGLDGVIACPCSNPPSGPGRGCDNSSATGGASLAAVGGAYLTSDSLIFTTSGEKPTALSLLAQWIGSNASGVVFGQGVRCTSGTLKRLFSKNAVGGSITVPDFGAGDPTVSARSAAKGDTIPGGASRWYFVYYRDNTVLGGCPATSNFNSTQTGRVTWSP